jgi:hypothetical protein
MYLIHQFIVGLIVAHVTLAIAYLAGSILRRPVERTVESRTTTVELVISTGLGLAVIGLATFVLGIAGLLTIPGLAAILIAIVCLGAVTKERVWEGRFWAQRLSDLGGAIRSPGLWLVWLIAVVLSFPAAQPQTAYDALFAHQVYALEWAQRHAIFVDLFRRFPWYASNWLLIDVWFYVLHLGDYVQFIGWATGALSAALAYGLTKERLARSPLADLAAGLATMPFLIAPFYLRWLNTGMIDAEIGFFFFLSVVVAARAAVSRSVSWPTVALIAGFLLGMKPTLLAFFPVFALLLVVAERRRFDGWRPAAVAVAVLALAAAPWYVKNIIEDGDPMPPIFNLQVFHRADGTFSKIDYENIASDFHVDRAPAALLRLPISMFLKPETNEFREVGTTAEVLFIGIPFAVLALAAWRRRYDETAYWAAMLVFAFAYLVYTAYYARYVILFYPLLTAFNARMLIAGLGCFSSQRFSYTSTGLAAASLLLAIPSPGGFSWLRQFYNVDYAYAGVLIPNKDAFLIKFLQGYTEEEAVSSWLRTHPSLPKRVLAFRLEPLAYYFAEHGIESIGDWVGPERYADLKTASLTDKVGEYIRRFNIAAILIPRKNELLTPAAIDVLASQLKKLGFQRMPTSGDIDVYVRQG